MKDQEGAATPQKFFNFRMLDRLTILHSTLLAASLIILQVSASLSNNQNQDIVLEHYQYTPCPSLSHLAEVSKPTLNYAVSLLQNLVAFLEQTWPVRTRVAQYRSPRIAQESLRRMQ